MDLMDSTTPTRRANVELHIDELVLHGFAARDRHHIAAVMEREDPRDAFVSNDYASLASLPGASAPDQTSAAKTEIT